jgi:hypothetical protein
MAQSILGRKKDQASAVTHGMALGTEVMTLEGALPVEYLNPGDRVLTRSGARRLRSMAMTRIQNARVVRISEDTLGVDHPPEPVLVTRDQPILIRDWRARALYGAAQALIPARRLVDGEFIRHEVVDDLRLYTLHFDAAEVIYAGGLELECAPETVRA